MIRAWELCALSASSILSAALQVLEDVSVDSNISGFVSAVNIVAFVLIFSLTVCLFFASVLVTMSF